MPTHPSAMRGNRECGGKWASSLSQAWCSPRIKGRGPVELLARNDAPQIVCDECGSLATAQICSECDSRGEGWLCEACAAKHECGEEMLLPVVNSPRAGV